MSPVDRLPSRAASPRRVQPSRGTQTGAVQPELLTPFRGFAAAMSELARQPQDRRIHPAS